MSSDKTKLTQFRDKSAYPIYLTIGNIPKHIRRKVSRHTHMLIGYIPISKLTGISSEAARTRAVANLFHTCMRTALGPIGPSGETGVDMMSGDGVWRRCHPILAIFVGDYPEQALVTCTYGGRCSKCEVGPDELGEYQSFPLRMQSKVLDTYRLADGDVHMFHQACREAGMKPIYRPFWEKLPLTDIFRSITPDILHQLLQGMVKHLVSWLIHIFGAAAINARCRALPPNHKILLFMKGITTLSYISGHEHKKISIILLGLIVDQPVPGGLDSSRVVRATRALLDFAFLAQYKSHTSESISKMQDHLIEFHENKAIFFDLGVRTQFNLPKLHSLSHYKSSISLFGTADNYNTEQSERLHIDLTKDAYRATNHKEEYSQMTTWLERREKVQYFSAFVDWRQQRGHDLRPPTRIAIGPPRAYTLTVKMTQKPSKKKVTFDSLANDFGALAFQDALAEFIAQLNYPGASRGALRNHAHNTHIPFSGVPVYHKIKFTARGDLKDTEIMDSVQVRPEQKDSRGRIIPARFDTVVVQGDKGNSHFVKQLNVLLTDNYSGRRIAQVRVVFQIPNNKIDQVFPSPDTRPPLYLAYVEWFTPIPARPDPKHRMYKVSRSIQNGQRNAAIIPVESIVCSVHLLPRFGPARPQEWNTFTVLEECHSFYINPFTDMYSYLTFG